MNYPKFANLLGCLLLAGCFLFTSCDDDEGIACTDEFVTVGFTVDGDPMPTLIRTYPKDDPNASRILVATDGRYELATDADRETLEDRDITYVVVGSDDTGDLFEEEFVIGADECHIMKVSGPEVITY